MNKPRQPWPTWGYIKRPDATFIVPIQILFGKHTTKFNDSIIVVLGKEAVITDYPYIVGELIAVDKNILGIYLKSDIGNIEYPMTLDDWIKDVCQDPENSRDVPNYRLLDLRGGS